MTSGFYKLHEDPVVLVRAGKFVHAPGFSLIAENKDSYTLPMDGWYWFDSKEEALAFFGCPEDVEYYE